MSHIESHLAAFDSDPVLAQVQSSLSVGVGGFPTMTGSGSGVPAAGSEIMNALIGLAVKGSHVHVPMTTSSQQPSTLGPAIGAGAAGLAVGAGAAAALMGGKGKPAAAAVRAGTPPAPPAEMPQTKPATGGGPVAASPKAPTPPPGGTATVPQPPTKAPTDPKKYSGFEEPELGKGTKIVLGAGSKPSVVAAPAKAPVASFVPPKPPAPPASGATPPPPAAAPTTPVASLTIPGWDGKF